MRFLAILKDSYKEAVSGWILQALMVLAGLLMLLVVGLSFRPVSPEEDIAGRFRFVNLTLRDEAKAGRPELAVENFVQTNAPEPLWKGNYKFDVVVGFQTPEDLQKFKKEGGDKLGADEVRQILRRVAPYLKGLTVKPAADPKPAEFRYDVRSEGTRIDDSLAWQSQPYLFFAVPTPPIFWMSLREAVYRIEKTLVNDFGAWAAMLVSVIVTAGFIPNVLRKGALDLYIAKPLGPVRLLLYKYIGGLMFVFLLAAFAVGGMWLVIGVRTGLWTPNFLLVVPILTFYFAILYAVSTLVGVLTRSALVAILVTVLVWVFVFGVGFTHETVETINEVAQKQLVQAKEMQGKEGVNPDDLRAVQPVPEVVVSGFYAARKALPRTYDMDKLTGRLIANGVLTEDELKEKGYDKPPAAGWPEVLIVSGLYIAVLLGLASWRLVTRDG